MAASNITIYDYPATIESDSTGAVISKAAHGSASLYGEFGELRNHGDADVFLFISTDSGDPATTGDVVTTGAQGQQQVPLPAGGSVMIWKDYLTIAHKTASGTAILSWVPWRTYA